MNKVTSMHVAAVLFPCFLLLGACNAKQREEAKQIETKKPIKNAESTQVKTATPDATKSVTMTENKDSGDTMSNPIVKLETNKGTLMIELDAEKAPKSAANFVEYVESGYYDGLIFHRVIPNFMVQGGGFGADMKQKSTNATVENEANNGLKNDRGTLAMARTNDPHSATSQFFINLKDNDFLNHSSESPAGWGYAVFGKVIEGIETIDEMAKVQTGNVGGHGDVPTEAITITKASLVK